MFFKYFRSDQLRKRILALASEILIMIYTSVDVIRDFYHLGFEHHYNEVLCNERSAIYRFEEIVHIFNAVRDRFLDTNLSVGIIQFTIHGYLEASHVARNIKEKRALHVTQNLSN